MEGPAEISALFEFLLTKVDVDSAVLAELSVSPARAASLNLRFFERGIASNSRAHQIASR